MSFLRPTSDDALGELFEAARQGDRGAFRSLYVALYDPVARFVARRVGRRHEAEEIVARVFHRVLERLADFDRRRGTPRMFVIAIARNLVVDHLRAARREEPIEDLAGVIASEEATALDALVRDEELRELREALLGLPPQAREVLALRYGDGLKHQEIAELLGVHVDAVKQRASRALRELRARVEAQRAQDEGEMATEGASDAGL
jgi:RNA polymerase sigma-70 factor (ECF subfamily)